MEQDTKKTGSGDINKEKVISFRTHGPRDSIESICRSTRFTKREIQGMYRNFKQECPTGFVDEDTFRQIFAKFFPYGNSFLYAHYVFKTFDPNRNGAITFKDFIQWLSMLCRGTPQEKLRWAFSLYDVNGDGNITKKEMNDVVCSVYALLGRKSVPAVDERALRNHVDRIFQKLDTNKDGVVTIDEFMETCLSDDTIGKSLALFDADI